MPSYVYETMPEYKINGTPIKYITYSDTVGTQSKYKLGSVDLHDLTLNRYRQSVLNDFQTTQLVAITASHTAGNYFTGDPGLSQLIEWDYKNDIETPLGIAVSKAVSPTNISFEYLANDQVGLDADISSLIPPHHNGLFSILMIAGGGGGGGGAYKESTESTPYNGGGGGGGGAIAYLRGLSVADNWHIRTDGVGGLAGMGTINGSGTDGQNGKGIYLTRAGDTTSLTIGGGGGGAGAITDGSAGSNRTGSRGAVTLVNPNGKLNISSNVNGFMMQGSFSGRHNSYANGGNTTTQTLSPTAYYNTFLQISGATGGITEQFLFSGGGGGAGWTLSDLNPSNGGRSYNLQGEGGKGLGSGGGGGASSLGPPAGSNGGNGGSCFIKIIID